MKFIFFSQSPCSLDICFEDIIFWHVWPNKQLVLSLSYHQQRDILQSSLKHQIKIKHHYKNMFSSNTKQFFFSSRLQNYLSQKKQISSNYINFHLMVKNTSWIIIACLLIASFAQNQEPHNLDTQAHFSPQALNLLTNQQSTAQQTQNTVNYTPLYSTSTEQITNIQPINTLSFPTLQNIQTENHQNTDSVQSPIPLVSAISELPPTTTTQTSSQYIPIQTVSPIVQNQTTTTTVTSIPLPTPITTTISNNAFGQITVDQSGSTQAQMYSPNCAEYLNGVCTKCSFRFVRGLDGVCEPVNPLCATWSNNGACLTCYSGYQICESGCIMSESCAPSGTYDPNCRNTTNGICQQCSIGYYFNQNGICTQVNPFCKTSNNQGDCLSCYAGYGLSNRNCNVLPNPSDSNPYCTKWVNGICQSCSNFSWLNGTICASFDPMCARTDPSNGQCLGCYIGYILGNGRCSLNTSTQPTDLLCRRWNSAGVCIQCSQNSFMRQNMCVSVDALCRTFDNTNGFCLSCYSGYNLNNGKCAVIPPNSDYTNTNQYCAVWQGTTCKQCAKNCFFNRNSICVPVNPYCATTLSGQCLSCYTGYTLQNNNCTIDNTIINVGNTLCSRWSGLTCLSCATRTYNQSGVCTAVNTLCNTWDSSNGFCLTCYNGFILSGNTCVINNQIVNGNPLCKTFNGPLCVECSTRSYSLNGICTAVDDSCATYSSQNGQCLSCYNGFFLQGGRCVAFPAAQPPAANTDIYCARTDSNGKCIRCFYGFALQSGVCVADFKNTPCGKDPKFCRK